MTPPGSLIACVDCGREISRRAPTCPHCGAPVAATPPPPLSAVSTGPKRIALAPPAVTPVYRDKITNAGGVGLGVFLGFLFSGGLMTCGYVAPTTDEQYVVFVAICIAIGVAVGLALAASESSDPQAPDREKTQSIKVPFACPHCGKSVEVTKIVAATRFVAETQSLTCSVCGTLSVVDWQMA